MATVKRTPSVTDWANAAQPHTERPPGRPPQPENPRPDDMIPRMLLSVVAGAILFFTYLVLAVGRALTCASTAPAPRSSAPP